MQEAETTLTLREATALAALYRRERDMVLGETEVDRTLRKLREANEVLAALVAKQTMQRPGIQNGLKKIEEIEAER